MRSRLRATSIDFVFIDCPPSLGPLTVSALAAADQVVVPIQCEYYALEGLSQLLDSIERLRSRLNPRLSIAGMVLTMADGRTRLSADVAAEVRRHFGDLVFDAVVPRSVRLAEAPSHGLPITAYDPGSAGADAYYRVANELVDRLGGGAVPVSDAAASVVASRCSWAARPPRPSSPSCPSARSRPTRASRGSGSTPMRWRPGGVGARAGRCPAGARSPPSARALRALAGERRWRAARAAGLATIPAVVRETDDRESLMLALVENVAREDLSAVEEARAYALLQDEFALSLGELSERVGRAKPTVSNRLRLLELPDDVLDLVERGSLSEGHARAVLAVPGDAERRALARKIVREGLSVRAAERAARWAGARTKPRRSTPVDPELAARARGPSSARPGPACGLALAASRSPFADETELAEIVESLERSVT